MMENQILSLLTEPTAFEELDVIENELIIREMITATISNNDKRTSQSEFDYYLNNLQRIDPLKTFVDNEGLFSDAVYILNCSMTKCEAIVHYIAYHDNIEFDHEDLILACISCESLALKLFEMGMDPHYVQKDNRMTPLHCAASGGFINLVKYLLNCQVDVNALNRTSRSALHYACIDGGSSAIVELIIESGANFFLDREPCSKTTLGITILKEHFDSASTILKSKICNNLDFDAFRDLLILICSHKFKDLDSKLFAFFLLLWEKLVQRFSSSIQSKSREQSILSIYLNNIGFQAKNWFNALKVILTSAVTSELLEEYATLEEEGIFAVLMEKFDQVGVGKENRIELIKLLFELDVKSNLMDLAKALLHFKYETEFEYLSLALRDDCLVNGEENHMEYVASVFCGLRDQLDFKRLENLDGPFYHFVTEYFTPVSFIGYLKTDEDSNIRIPNIPSLKELSRNAVRRFVTESTEILLPNHFSNFVNSLKIPVKCINFIILKTPLKEF